MPLSLPPAELVPLAALLAVLLLIAALAAAVTVVDAREAPHRRVVAVQRREAWQARLAPIERPGSSRTSGTSVR